jgi:hypothetical protein
VEEGIPLTGKKSSKRPGKVKKKKREESSPARAKGKRRPGRKKSRG